MMCRNPRCENSALAEQKWCRPCGERLVRIRTELEADMDRVRKGRSISRRCRAIGCGENKAFRSMFCHEHQYLEVE